MGRLSEIANLGRSNSNIMNSLYRLVDLVFRVLDLALLLRVVFSWINANPYNSVVRLIHDITEPILAPLRRYIPPIGGFDFTPMVALVILDLVQRLIVSLLF
jgi:YggT family protein